MQMVGLYRDPEGKTIFSKTDPSQANAPPTSDQCTIDTLKRRVQELENVVTVIGACSGTCTVCIKMFGIR